ncbi:ABC transporter permease [Ureibacillus manganicus]|uniref:ABC transporter permease n=1 Tax=Ureibacillus manganicus DSM 26584 TaxID=1384049 RepID=A0A0A3I5D8_9BACL|nr:ABC transporter permease [Ureibacillus manganicus]KGR78725.1 ABC transporter permease [Ureibacillus manganicus DSM 26584]
MAKYLRKRLLEIIPVLLFITFIVFFLVFWVGDPVALMLPEDAKQEDIENLRSALKLDEPMLVQFGYFVSNVVQGDFGKSFRYGEDALPIVLERLPSTLTLAFTSMIIAVLIAIPAGIISAIRRNSATDVFVTGFSILGKAMPSFWLGIMLILIFGVIFKILPVSGNGTWAHLVLPSITLGTAVSAEMTRLVRSNMLAILQQDYIRTAISKGVKPLSLILKHGFKNALVPVITIMFLQISTLVSGALVTEVVFAYPGLGQLLVQAVSGRDMAIIQAAIFVVAIMVILLNLLADLLYKVFDPRIKYN